MSNYLRRCRLELALGRRLQSVVVFAFDFPRGGLGGPLRLGGAVPVGEGLVREGVGGLLERDLGAAERFRELADLGGAERLLEGGQRHDGRPLLLRRGALGLDVEAVLRRPRLHRGARRRRVRRGRGADAALPVVWFLVSSIGC